MAQVIFAGIDVSAPKLDLVCIDEHGIQLSSSRSFPNNLEGANALVQTLVSIANRFNVNKLNIGLEATSVYSVYLRNFLTDAPQLKPYSVEVFEINPSLVAGFKKAFGSKLPKTDAIDAYIIAERMRFGHLAPYNSQAASVTEPLRQLTRLRVHLNIGPFAYIKGFFYAFYLLGSFGCTLPNPCSPPVSCIHTAVFFDDLY